MKWYGIDGDSNVVVMDLLGPSLEDLLIYCGGKFSLKTVLILADQMVIFNLSQNCALLFICFRLETSTSGNFQPRFMNAKFSLFCLLHCSLQG